MRVRCEIERRVEVSPQVPCGEVPVIKTNGSQHKKENLICAVRQSSALFSAFFLLFALFFEKKKQKLWRPTTGESLDSDENDHIICS